MISSTLTRHIKTWKTVYEVLWAVRVKAKDRITFETVIPSSKGANNYRCAATGLHGQTTRHKSPVFFSKSSLLMTLILTNLR